MQVFAISTETEFPGCPAGSIVEVLLARDDLNLDDFIQMHHRSFVWVKLGEEVFIMEKRKLKNFWIV